MPGKIWRYRWAVKAACAMDLEALPQEPLVRISSTRDGSLPKHGADELVAVDGAECAGGTALLVKTLNFVR